MATVVMTSASAAVAPPACSGCRTVLNFAISSSGIVTTTTSGALITESLTSYAVLSGYRLESLVAPTATAGGVGAGNALGCAVSTHFTSTLAVPSSYPLPATRTDGDDTSIASRFISQAHIPACGLSPGSLVLERVTEQAVGVAPAAATSTVSPSASSFSSFTTSTIASLSAGPQSAAPTVAATASPPILQAGVGVGVGVTGAVVALLASYAIRRYRRRRRLVTTEHEIGGSETGFVSKAELPAHQLPEVDGADCTREAASEPCFELPAEEVAGEKD